MSFLKIPGPRDLASIRAAYHANREAIAELEEKERALREADQMKAKELERAETEIAKEAPALAIELAARAEAVKAETDRRYFVAQAERHLRSVKGLPAASNNVPGARDDKLWGRINGQVEDETPFPWAKGKSGIEYRRAWRQENSPQPPAPAESADSVVDPLAEQRAKDERRAVVIDERKKANLPWYKPAA